MSNKKPKRRVLNRIFKWIKKSGKTLVGKTSAHTPPPQVISDDCRKATNKIMDSLVQGITKLRDEKEAVARSSSRKNVITTKWIYLTDSGGSLSIMSYSHSLFTTSQQLCVSFAYPISLMSSSQWSTIMRVNVLAQVTNPSSLPRIL